MTSTDPAATFAHDVVLSYKGARQVERTVRIGLTFGAAETAVKTTEVYDRHGRLYQVTEPSGDAGALVTTTYGYDVGNRLASVATGAQTRTFAYDRAGLLQWENHPEKTVNVLLERDVSYPSYDSRGHLRRKVDGDDDLSFAYDTAERLTQVSETGGNVLKGFVYATANGTNDWRKGKLYRQSRYNYVTIGGAPYTVHLRDTFAYGGRDGRVSKRDLENVVNGALKESFSQSFTYDPLGNLKQLTYPDCTHVDCAAKVAFTVENTYDNGLLTAVGLPGSSGHYAGLAYHPNLLVSEVAHRVNGAATVRDLQFNDPHSMRRPSTLQAQTPAGVVLWSAGPYTYDGAGNIRSIGNSTFDYDRVSRLTSGTVDLAPTGAANLKPQSYTYDLFGNILSITTNGSQLLTPTSSATNRLNGAGSVYDASGNLTEWSNNKYTYDPLGNLWRYQTAAGKEWVYLYTADDERVWSFAVGQNSSVWTLRGLDGKLLREYANHGGAWSRTSDSIYRGDLLLAAETSAGLRHYSLDHLGTPRLITDQFGTRTAYHVYYPFGQEATAFNQDTIRTKFTGHERDLADTAGTGDDLDYMHARFGSPLTARFLSPDPAAESVDPKQAQSFNRYTYALNNPMKFVDPSGRIWDYVLDGAGITYDLYQLAVEPSWGNLGTLVADAGLAVAPFAPTIGGLKLATVGADALKAADHAGNAIGFAKGSAQYALTSDRLQHASRHLTAAGILPAWNKQTGEVFKKLAEGILEKPSKTFDYVLKGGSAVKGFAGKVDGKDVVFFVFKSGKYQGKVATAVVPSAEQAAKWGLN